MEPLLTEDIMEVKVDVIEIEGLVYTEDDLLTMIKHYNAIQILIQSAKNNKDYKALSDWDDARR